MALGLGTRAANATDSIAQWPGQLGGMAGFRRDDAGQRSRLVRFRVVARLGGTGGSVVLLTTPSEAFDLVVLVPVLLTATSPWSPRPAVHQDAADQPKSGCAGLSLYAVLHALQSLLATWTGACIICGQRITTQPPAPT